MTPHRSRSSRLGRVITRYVGLKTALGRGFDGERRVLQALDAFLRADGGRSADLTPASLSHWTQTLTHVSATVRRKRLQIVRNLCLYRRRTEPACFVPDPMLFPACHQPRLPFLFAPAEIARLLRAARTLERTPGSPLRPEVLRLAIVLLYTTGLRRAGVSCSVWPSGTTTRARGRSSFGRVSSTNRAACRSRSTGDAPSTPIFGRAVLATCPWPPTCRSCGMAIPEAVPTRAPDSPWASGSWSGPRRSARLTGGRRAFMICATASPALVPTGSRCPGQAALAGHVHGSRLDRFAPVLSAVRRAPSGRRECALRAALWRPRRRAPPGHGEEAMTRRHPIPLACTLRAFFTDYLSTLRGLSPHTIGSYRDSLTLLLRFAAAQQGRDVAVLDVEHLPAAVVIAFLSDLETTRHCTARTRNIRLAALHTFFRFLASQHPDRLEHAQRILGIPFKRTRPRPIEYLEHEELQAVLATVDRTTPAGAPRLHLAGHPVQYGGPGAGAPRRPVDRSSADHTPPSPARRQRPQTPHLSPLAADGAPPARPLRRTRPGPRRRRAGLRESSRDAPHAVRGAVHSREIPPPRGRHAAAARAQATAPAQSAPQHGRASLEIWGGPDDDRALAGARQRQHDVSLRDDRPRDEAPGPGEGAATPHAAPSRVAPRRDDSRLAGSAVTRDQLCGVARSHPRPPRAQRSSTPHD